jgi:hypothetical protein
MKNTLALIGQVLLVLVALLCFVVVGLMYTKLSFIDTPYLLGGLAFLAIALIWRIKSRSYTDLNKKI